MRHWTWFTACMAMATVSHAQVIHKCMDGTVVAYQSVPCGEGQPEAGVIKLPAYADPPQSDGATAPPTETSDSASSPPAASLRGFPFRTSIELGMTDDQVLNTPRWGPPVRISRTRMRHGWREEWRYARADGEHELEFVNGKLARIDATSATVLPVQLASAAPAQRPHS